MKNMKRLISIIAVLAMMLSMATVSFAAIRPITGDESFNITISNPEVLEGTTDEFYVRVAFTYTSETGAAQGLANWILTLNFDQNVIVPGSYDDIVWSGDQDSTKVQKKSTNAEGTFYVGYKVTVADNATQSGDYIDIPFTLADGAEGGDTTTVTAVGAAAVNAIAADGSSSVNWITKANVANYVTAGSVSVISATPPAPPTPILVDGDATETSLDNADPKDNNIVVWGSITNSEYLTDDYEYGLEITDGANAGFYPALGLKEGKFGIKLIGNLVDASLASITRLYMYDGESYTYLD